MTRRTDFRFRRDERSLEPPSDDEDDERDRLRRAELRDIEADRRHDEEAIYGERSER